jgi:hypothetical protein
MIDWAEAVASSPILTAAIAKKREHTFLAGITVQIGECKSLVFCVAFASKYSVDCETPSQNVPEQSQVGVENPCWPSMMVQSSHFLFG